MELCIDLAAQIASMVIIVLAGFALIRLKLMTTEESRVLSRSCVYIIIPCTMITSFQKEMNPEQLSGLLLAFIASLIIHAVTVSIALFMRKTPLAMTKEEEASTIYNNAGSLVIPMIYGISSLGAPYVFYTSAYIILQNSLMWSWGQITMGYQGKISFTKIFFNPCLVSIFIGLFLFFTQIQITGPIQTAMVNTAACLGPISMLVIGMLLGEQDLKAIVSNWNIYRVTAIRLIFFPLVSVGILFFLSHVWPHPDSANILTVILLCAIGPAASTITQLAQLFNNPHSGYVSAINVMSTLCCAITMPIIVLLFQFLLQF